MTYKEAGFRAFYKHFIVLTATERIKSVLEGLPGADEADGILAYGYIDRQMGLTLDVLAAAYIREDGVSFGEESKEVRSIIRMDAATDDEFLFLADEDGKLAERFAEKLQLIEEYYGADEEVERTREMAFLDGCRHESCVDDVLVYLVKEGLNPEGCWVRITGLGDRCFLGTLLNEPDQDFGVHMNEKITFYAQKSDDRIICFSPN